MAVVEFLRCVCECEQTGGQMFDMPTGRLDGMISSTESANDNLVSPQSSASELTQKFLAQGLGQDEMITLSGTNKNF